MKNPEWLRLLKGSGLPIEGDRITVTLAQGRSHIVRVEDEDATLRLAAIVIKAQAAARVKDLYLRIWKRNRSTRLVGFRVDDRGRLIGEAHVPKAGLSREELEMCVRHVASECDRLEYLLTGEDVE